jgi:hypothetical protein
LNISNDDRAVFFKRSTGNRLSDFDSSLPLIGFHRCLSGSKYELFARLIDKPNRANFIIELLGSQVDQQLEYLIQIR